MEGGRSFWIQSTVWSPKAPKQLSNSNPGGGETFLKYVRREEEKDGFKKN